jgi:16S rRNA (cytosine967-C5)-methyltransferase
LDGQGFEIRRVALATLQRVTREKITIEEALDDDPATEGLPLRDRAFATHLLMTAFRHRGEIEAVLDRYLARPLPRRAGAARSILWLATAQLLFLRTPAYAVIDIAVRLAKSDRGATHFSGLINAVLRNVSSVGTAALAGLDSARLNTPDWLWKRWARHYGEDLAWKIASANLQRPSLDLSTRGAPDEWARRLGGTLLPTGQIRLPPDHDAIPNLDGFDEGAWWVQDAAAALPVRLFGDPAGRTVLDLCAAPGGKTMQLCSAGAIVTAVDSSKFRVERLRENLKRVGFDAEIRVVDLLDHRFEGQFDGVLLDAPCSATGTIRRHPELPYLRDDRQIAELASLQRRMLQKAADLVKPGGLLVYCTCATVPSLTGEFYQTEGWIRTLPCQSLGDAVGLDGFFMAALRRSV